MKVITFDDWLAGFDPVSANEDVLINVNDDPDAYQFFDNGAVREIRGGDYVITADQMKKI